MFKNIILITILLSACSHKGEITINKHPLDSTWLEKHCSLTDYTTDENEPVYKRNSLRFVESRNSGLNVSFSLYGDDQCTDSLSYIIGEWERVFSYRWADQDTSTITISKIEGIGYLELEDGIQNDVIYKITNNELCLGDNFYIDDSATFPHAIIEKRSGTLSQDCFTLDLP